MAEFEESHVVKLHKKLKERREKKGTTSFFTQTIEKEFAHSWDWVRGLYQGHPCRENVWKLLDQMREKGYHKKLRAGQSMWKLMLSRSVNHGLREEQPYVFFYFSEEGINFGLATNNKDETETHSNEFHLTPEIENLLQQLLTQTVD